ncbi:MAG: hypothetical protein J6S14_13475 [Clostridia bacterium]|nr:hypothetical protein [Clostridia bacterium]
MNVGEVVINDHSKEVLDAMNSVVLRALEKCGMTAESYAKKLCDGFKHPTSNLRNHIEYKVVPNERAVYVGTNVKYAVYVELGTGMYYPNGGRQGWWVYVKDGESSSSGSKNKGKIYTKQQAALIMHSLQEKGLDAHMTCGQKPHPFLKPAVTDHKDKYRNIIRNELKG